MTERAQLAGGDAAGFLITLVVLGAVVLTGVAVMDDAAAGVEPDSEYMAAADAHCEQELGVDADLYVANVVGRHGGLHCEGPGGALIHYHDVPDSEVYAAADGGDRR
ncbi:hypothetical protein [Halorubrum sp. LN27]|uniref:hypothetical protein n=1 Tax=Halorubrum sp. LN27 TaxID=2801032 RepID=UPI00190A3FAC|nr:hypothetical protein [Halorubrum sp. LN27]